MVLPYTIHRTLFELGPIHITSWGFFVALGFIAGLYFIIKEAKRKNLDVDQAYNLALLSIVGGLIGARVGWLLTEGQELGFSEALQFWNGGMIWHGGLLGALLLSFIYLRVKNINFLKYADVFALGIPLGHAIGRIGCYLNGYHLGKITEVPWAVSFGGQLRHPMPLYEIIFLVLLFIVLWRLKDKRIFEGALFSTYLLSYAVVRFFLDFLRDDPMYFGLTVAQHIAIVIFLTSSLFIYLKSKNKV